jgi:hypothetical protein
MKAFRLSTPYPHHHESARVHDSNQIDSFSAAIMAQYLPIASKALR